MLDQCKSEFDTWLTKWGRSRCDAIMRTHLRRRLETDVRPPRVRFSWGEYKRLYEQQRGICPLCQETMPFIRGKIEMDHINVNLTGEAYNSRSNRQVVCTSCNKEKGALSIPAQAKRYGKPMTEILSGRSEVSE